MASIPVIPCKINRFAPSAAEKIIPASNLSMVK